MAEWIEVDQGEINKPIRSDVDLKVYVSPYDIPEAVRGEYDDRIQRFSIFFKYLSSEERLVRQPEDRHVDLYVGAASRRIHRIDIDVNALKADSVQLTLMSIEKAVEGAIDSLSKQPSPRPRRGNYVAAKRALRQRRQRLAELALAPN